LLGETKGFENQDGSPDGIALDGVRCAHTILTLGFDFDVWVSPRLPRRFGREAQGTRRAWQSGRLFFR
jgi:hypothetical protein